MIALVTSYNLQESGLTAVVQVGDSSRNVPVDLDWTSATIKSDLCSAIKADCIANGTPVTRVVLPDLYSE
jgi:hypothetical protein